MSLTFVDIFCGAGGSSTGMVAAGLELKLAANHWDRAIETHAANHPTADHLCADVNQYDMRRMPRADVLWASPICTEISPAGGRRRISRQLSLLDDDDPVPSEAFERTRATAYDVIRYIEVHRPSAVVCENVPEFATDWELFRWWRTGIETLGYTSQVVSASSAHLSGDGNEAAPQWRNRIYIVFSRTGIVMPDLSPTPAALCPTCDTVGPSRQRWKNGRSVGKYRDQYVYVSQCCRAAVEPAWRPAADIIDWADLGTRIGDRKKPLVPNTLARIQAGLDLDDPYIVEYRRHSTATTVRRPLATVTAGGNHHGLVVPDAFLIKNYGGKCSPAANVVPIGAPVSTVTARDGHALVIPYRKGRARPTSEPLLTLATRDSAGVLRPSRAIEDCHYRMLKPREQLAAQRFPADYIVYGNKGEQTMQAGNAVSVNAGHYFGAAVAEALQ